MVHKAKIKMNTRTQLLLGEAGMKHLQDAHVLVVGLGGVGGAALEMIARAGVGKLTIVDADTVNTSNLNRQLIATRTVLEEYKSEAWRERLLSINLDLDLHVYTEFLEEDNTKQILTAAQYDFVVDAIDTISSKVFLIHSCVELGIPIISSMGSGGKKDPSQVQLTDISKTTYCSLAKVVRRRLYKLGVKKGVMCVFSTEMIDKNAIVEVQNEKYKRTTTGTVSYMPNLFGCWIASYVIRKISGNE